ncbi:MAG: Holliday junction branch migration protein RuvA [Heliobacteriaceae bacterium]|nr:Holliday junction branch migration protein RuvA [Heliobacteriaceae bacterium]
MIAFLCGRIAGFGEDCLLLDVGGVGYRVYIPAGVFAALPAAGEKIMVHTYFHLREDQAQLYGFLSAEELELFRLLLAVSGIGPKVGLAILSTYSAAETQRAIVTEDVLMLTGIPGIGRKTAQRLVIELRDKLLKKGLHPVKLHQMPVDTGDCPTGWSETGSRLELPAVKPAGRDEAFTALQALGFTANEARDALGALVATVEPAAGAEEWLKAALKYLAAK